MARLAQQKPLPSQLKPFSKALADQQRALEQASAKSDSARATRDAALAAIAGADETLDRSLDTLANRLAGADLGPRKNPFTPFGGIAPTTLKQLGYSNEIAHVEKLVAAIKKAKPPAAVQSALTAVTSAAQAAKKALGGVSAPQAAYSAALAARDALLPDWQRAYERLRVNAKAVWIDEPAVYKAVFAPPGISAPRGKRRRGAAETPEASGPQPPVAVEA